LVGTFLQVLLFTVGSVILQAGASAELTPQLSEVGETRSSHPDDEVLLFDVNPLDLLPGLAIGGLVAAVALSLVLELVVYIRLPGDVVLLDFHFS
jgi:hypothetical protein